MCFKFYLTQLYKELISFRQESFCYIPFNTFVQNQDHGVKYIGKLLSEKQFVCTYGVDYGLAITLWMEGFDTILSPWVILLLQCAVLITCCSFCVNLCFDKCAKIFKMLFLFSIKSHVVFIMLLPFVSSWTSFDWFQVLFQSHFVHRI